MKLTNPLALTLPLIYIQGNILFTYKIDHATLDNVWVEKDISNMTSEEVSKAIHAERRLLASF